MKFIMTLSCMFLISSLYSQVLEDDTAYIENGRNIKLVERIYARDTMILKFYRVNKNTDLIGNKRITYRDLTDDELRDIVTYYNTEKDFKNLKAGTTNLDALTIQQLINLQAYYKVNRIP